MLDVAASSQAAFAVSSASHRSIFPVELHDLVYEISGHRLLDGLDLALRPGLRTAIMGPNGAGKSLTLRLLQGLLTPTAGSISWAGARGEPAIFRKVALVPQRPVLLRRTVAGNLAHALGIYGVARRQRARRIDALLALAEMAHLRNRPARVLSGGEQQSLAIIRALAAKPDLLLLDEPTASLDPRATQSVEKLIDAAHQRGVKIVLVTHDPGQARRMADEVAFLHRGRASEHTPIDDFFAAPRSEAARAYLDGQLLV